jgi:Uma2 family endonuclease
MVIDGRVRIPMGITDLAAFRQWCHSADFPEEGRFAYLDGTIWVDLSMEQAFSHNDVKTGVASVLWPLARAIGTGRYFGDGMRLSHPEANLTTDPDGLFYFYATLQSGRLIQVAGRHGGVVEFEGTPDMVLEVVSDTSVEKDMVRLPPLYERAGIQEFWRIDAQGKLVFELFRLTPGGYVSAQLPDGWLHSDVFGRDFHLAQGIDPTGQPQFTLEVR